MMRESSFERAAAAYEEHAQMQAASARELAARLAELLPGVNRGRTLLDVGSGTGLVAQALADRGWPGAVVGLDCSPAMCNIAARRGRQSIVGDAQSLPFREGSFAGCASNWAFHWFTDPARALAEVARTLEPSAPFACTVPGAGSLRSWREALGQSGCTLAISPEFLSEDRWLQLLVDQGFELIDASTTQQDLIYPSAREFLRHLRGMGALGEPVLARSTIERGQLLGAARLLQRGGSVRAEFRVTTLVARAKVK